MIFVGDIASPNSQTTEELVHFLHKNEEVFLGQSVIANLEGLLEERDPGEDKHPILFNYRGLPAAMKAVTKPVFCLANNHVLDLPEAFESTAAILKKEGIPFGGAGSSSEDAGRAIFFKEGKREVILLNACWDFLLYHQKNPSSGVYVHEMDEAHLISEVYRLKSEHPEATLVLYLHWSLDLESLPFPMYRQFSRALIDAGARLVIGTHAHCVQGGEVYGDGAILYGLGNFMMPDQVYAGGRLKFPDFAKLELALELDLESNRLKCHWYEYRISQGQHVLDHLESDDFENSPRIRTLSPYQDMDEGEYLSYYKKNRRKKILIPVYRDYRKKRLNAFYTRILKTRARTAHSLAKMKFIKWQN